MSLEKRVKWAKQAIEQYPNKYPIIIEKAEKSDKLEDLVNPK